MRIVEPARMSSGFDKWFTAANDGNCAASPNSRSAIPLNVSPGATGTSRSPEVSGRAEGAAVRASAGSCRIHPGRGEAVRGEAAPIRLRLADIERDDLAGPVTRTQRLLGNGPGRLPGLHGVGRQRSPGQDSHPGRAMCHLRVGRRPPESLPGRRSRPR